jgi:hypothetical protein
MMLSRYCFVYQYDYQNKFIFCFESSKVFCIYLDKKSLKITMGGNLNP